MDTPRDPFEGWKAIPNALLEGDPFAGERQMLWPDPDNGPHRLRVTFGTANGRPAVLAIEISQAPGEPTAIAATAARVPVGALLDQWVAERGPMVRAANELRHGRTPLTAEFLDRVMRFYVDAVASGSRSPTKDVAEYFGARSVETARSWVNKARRQQREKGTNQ